MMASDQKRGSIVYYVDTEKPPLDSEPEFISADIRTPRWKWQTKAAKSTPWSGLVALTMAILSAVAIAVVLSSANGKVVETWPSEKWPIQLAVVLAILIAFGNANLAMAYSEGVTISWWVKMLKGGDLGDSHRYWQHGMSAWVSIRQLHLVSKVSIASILVMFLLIDAPLLQHAATTTTVLKTLQSVFQAALAPDVLSQATALYMSHAPEVNTLMPNFSAVVQNYNSRTPINLKLNGCNGTCSGTVVAAGFDTSCQTSKVPYALDPRPGSTTAVGGIDVEFFGLDAPEILNITTLYKSTEDSQGNLIRNQCILHYARVKYSIQYNSGDGMTLQPWNSSVNNTLSLEYLGPEIAGLQFSSQLGGISLAIRNMFESDVQLYNAGTYAIQGSGPMVYTFMSSNQSALGTGEVTWVDPMPSIINAVNELTFRAAIAFSNNTSQQTVEGTQKRIVNQYVLRSGFLAGAMAIVAVGVLAVISLFNEYWLLGRRVSMSPLEVAKAFQAPMTVGACSNAEVGSLLQQIGGRPIKYGAIHQADGNEQRLQTLAITSPDFVSWPKNDHYYI